MLYLGIIFIIWGTITLITSNDPLGVSSNQNKKLKDKKGYYRFKGITYIVYGLVALATWFVSKYSSANLLIPVLAFCVIGAIFETKYRKKFFE
jgi:uncharacterized membrane protein HdeD (DUF308 family)